MAPRSALLLAVLALLLGAGVYLLEVRVDRERLDREDAARALFPTISAGDVVEIRLQTPDGHAARLKRHGGRWALTEPVSFPADTVAIDGMASTLGQLAFEEEVLEPAGRSVYGLDDPSRRIVFETGDGEAELWIGDGAPGGGRSYVATSASDHARVFVVATWRVTSLRKPLDDLRDRRVLPFDRAAVDEVEVHWPGGRVVADRLRDGTGGRSGEADAAAGPPGSGWRLTAPVVGPADSDTIEDLLSDLAFLQADGFDDAPSPEALAELLEPDFDVVLRGRPEEGDDAADEPFEARFTLGGFASRGLRHARGAHETTLYRIPAERLAEFPRSVASYRSRELARFDADRVARLEISFGAVPAAADPGADAGAPPAVRTLRVERREDGWQAAGDRLDAAAVTALIDELALLEASRIVAEEMGSEERAALGLEPPRVQIRVYGAAASDAERAPSAERAETARAEAARADRLLADVRLGRTDPARGTFAMRPDAPLVYAIDRDLAARLPSDADRFAAALRPSEAEPID